MSKDVQIGEGVQMTTKRMTLDETHKHLTHFYNTEWYKFIIVFDPFKPEKPVMRRLYKKAGGFYVRLHHQNVPLNWCEKITFFEKGKQIGTPIYKFYPNI